MVEKKDILKDVKIIPKNEKDFLAFIYENKEFNKEYEIYPATEATDGRRYIRDDNFIQCIDGVNKAGLRYLIEDEINYSGQPTTNRIIIQSLPEQVSNYSEEQLHKTNYKGFIFLENVNFSGSTFNEKADFSQTIFLKRALFKEVVFRDKSDFWGSTFISDSFFIKTKFNKNARFDKVFFNKLACFIQSIFTQRAEFREVFFIEYADFENVVFTYGVSFALTVFKKSSTFSNLKLERRGEFLHTLFEEDVNFRDSIFNGVPSFGGSTTFTKEADFSNSKFNKVAYFSGLTFKGKTDFSNSIFNEKIIFSNSIFKKLVNFSDSIFKKEACFLKSTFNEKINFFNATFNKKTDFSESTFKKEADFELSKINFLLFDNIKGDGIFNLQKSQIDKISYSGTNIKKVKNRETFLVLKNLALKQNDQISALDFHKKEYEKHFEELSFKNNFSDKFILYFEKMISGFGTSISKSITSFIIFNLTIIALYILLYNNFSCLKLTDFVELVISLKADNFTYFHVITLIINPILIYEIIKSFRKYSRRL